MLFFNVDHIEKELLQQSREASSRFFLASAAMCEVFAHLENGDVAKAGDSARRAAEHFEGAADSFRRLALSIDTQYPWVNNTVRDVSFNEAAQGVHLSPDLGVVKEVTLRLVRGELSGVLLSCAIDISHLAERLRALSSRVLGSTVLDVEYNEAHLMMGNWRTLVTRGQYVSSVCLISMRVTV
jgi:hypothetical protein